MVVFTKRAQTYLTEEQHDALSHLSSQMRKPVSVLVREALEKVYFEEAEHKRRQQALAALLLLDAPVVDCEQMEG